MDPRHLEYYNRELQHIREIGGEFAAEFPKIAGRLGLSGFECADPYVERLLEGFAYLAARVQLKIDAQFPAFTQHLLEVVYPHYLAPMPSMAVVQFQPDLTEGALAEGYVLPRNSSMKRELGTGQDTFCEYRTAHELTLWPLELTAAEYFVHAGPVVKTDLAVLKRSKAGIRLRLRCTAGLNLDQLNLDRLPLFLRGADELPFRLYELLSAKPVAVIVQPIERPLPWCDLLDPSALAPRGFADADALLPYPPASFQGYRNLHEYFAFPERFLFVELRGLSPSLRRTASNELDIIILLPRRDPVLEQSLDASNFGLFCTPAINLFPKRCDRIRLSEGVHEHHLIPDRTRPLDYEVYQVNSVTGYTEAERELQTFLPFYAAHDLTSPGDHPAYYSLHRVPRRLSSRQRREGPRTSYIGSEVYLDLVDTARTPYRSDLYQLGVTTLCTNRDLPLQLPVGTGGTDFGVAEGAPVAAVRVVAGPTAPRPSHAHGDTAWRLISHLSLNYLSLVDGAQDGAAALRELLALYGDAADAAIRKQIEGVQSVASRPITRRLPGARPVTYARGLEITLSCDETAFEGSGVFLLGSVLERFFARYAAINSFTETVLKTGRGEMMRWPATIGRRQIL
ncbi:type VI secretion system baseplate subunit TssF [Candidatus Thiosymbion oneisti]|uniref:type VI secretion system baseplate subunit TssF n=1 Tax=Candidatus Thiosymbion oneisti TaxID=589554 RepID=UPI000A61C405|nr:type VI secretion system baseplate subunit TssF [Candidatus Thiosymbion oneisti]